VLTVLGPLVNILQHRCRATEEHVSGWYLVPGTKLERSHLHFLRQARRLVLQSRMLPVNTT
jgi:hypothetical protein